MCQKYGSKFNVLASLMYESANTIFEIKDLTLVELCILLKLAV